MIDLEKIKIIADRITDIYREKLDEKNINASGTLSNTVEAEVEIRGNKIIVSLNLQDYWKFVEEGRPPGGYPPPPNIANWIRIKPVIPDARSGKIPSEKQLVYLISRKIATKGYEGRFPLKATLEDTRMNDIIQDIKTEIVRQLQQQLLGE
jgi:hypothetical protein